MGPLHLHLQSHLCLTLAHVGGPLWIWIQLQFHFCVVPFDLNLQGSGRVQEVGSTLALAPVQSLSQPELFVGGGNSQKIWSQLHFLVYRNLSAVHDWIDSLPSEANEPKSTVVPSGLFTLLMLITT